MRKTLLLCVALLYVPAGFAGELINLRPTRSQADGNPFRVANVGRGISKFNPLRPANRGPQQGSVDALRGTHSSKVTSSKKPIVGYGKIETDKRIEINSTVEVPSIIDPSIQVAQNPVDQLPLAKIEPKPMLPPDAFDDIELVTRGILTPDVSVLVPNYLAEMVKQPQRSLFESISDRSLLDNGINVRVGLHELLAGTIKNNVNFKAYNYRVVEPKTWFGKSMQRFDWDELPETRPVEGFDDESEEDTYRISLNYSQMPNSFDPETKSTRPIIRADVRASNLQVVEALLRQLDAVATEYWTVVAERGKLVAATDQLNFCEQVLHKVESLRDVIPENVVALARTGYKRSAKVRSDAMVRLTSAQSRLANLVGDPMLQGAVELLPKELPAGVDFGAVEQEVEIANKNRADAKTSPDGVAMDVMLAHQRLGYALEESNRSFRAIHSVKANFASATDTETPVQKLTMALELQDRLRESTTHFLDAIVQQQRSLLDMKRAKGTLARTEIFPSTSKLPEILTPGKVSKRMTVDSRQGAPYAPKPGSLMASPNGDPIVPPPAVAPVGVGLPGEVARQLPGPAEGRSLAGNPERSRRPIVVRPVSPMHGSAVPVQRSSQWTAAKKWLSKLTENQPLQKPTRR